MLPAAYQLGIPGSQELIIILLILFFFVIPVGMAVMVVLYVLRRMSGDDERVEELEREVEALREERGRNPEGPDDQLE